MSIKLGLDIDALKDLGLREFYNAYCSLDEDKDDLESAKLSNLDLDEKGNRDITVDENNYQALIIAFSEMIEANNSALVLQLIQLGLLRQ
jgi:hypothetical protein